MSNQPIKYNITVDDVERRILVQALADLKDKQRLEGKEYDFLDTLILRLCDAQQVKGKLIRFNEER